MVFIGSSAPRSRTKSNRSPPASGSRQATQKARTLSSSALIFFGMNARDTSARWMVCSGGSSLMNTPGGITGSALTTSRMSPLAELSCSGSRRAASTSAYGSVPRSRVVRCSTAATHPSVAGMSDTDRRRSRRPRVVVQIAQNPSSARVRYECRAMLYGRTASTDVERQEYFMTDRFCPGWAGRHHHRRRHRNRPRRRRWCSPSTARMSCSPGRRSEPLESTAKEIEALGRRALAVPTDVTDGRRVPAARRHDAERVRPTSTSWSTMPVAPRPNRS